MELPPQPGAGPESTGTNEEHEMLRNDGPRIYVASLSDYNAGILHGAWIAADQEPEDLHEAVNTMLQRSPTQGAEEFALLDFEGFGHYDVEEYDSLEWISRIALGIAQHGPAFGAWAEHCDHEADALDRFEDAYLGDWSSVSDYAEELIDDLGYTRLLEEAVPEMLAPYVQLDIEGFARDLELGGDITTVEHHRGVWIFEGHL
jgi:antirestriction protein